MTTRHPTARHTVARAFTLVELLVAIGAVAIIAVGVAAIFASVGRTVAGGRRVGQLNQYAALIERQMRADFEAMTRDGVLVIRHEEAFEGANIPLDAEDTTPRPRRVDQIIFFTRGQFSTARSPMIPGVNATASEAMVRYGHGVRLDPIEDFQQDPAYERPQVDDGWFSSYANTNPYRPELGLGDSTFPATNPNYYASGWTLQRNLVLLATPGSADQNLPPASDPVWGDLGITRADALDNEIQIGGQPAASTVFSSLQGIFPTNTRYPVNLIRTAAGDPPRRPVLASGVVDIATTSLEEIRRYITDIGANPWAVTDETDLYDPGNPAGSLLDDRFSHSGGAGDAMFMQRWMDDLFPAHTHAMNPAYAQQLGIRPRYEPAFPDLVGTLTDFDAGGGAVAEQNMRLADQMMLSSSVFVPRCTEFIVEYTFGQTYPDATSPLYGTLIWYGADRDVTVNGVRRQAVAPYPIYYDPTDPANPSHPGNVYQYKYEKLDGSDATRALDPGLVYRTIGPAEDIVTAHFGYIDPLYTPGGSNDPQTLPWPWPKLIRITMTLADPTDPSIEQTFQFIFKTPDAGGE